MPRTAQVAANDFYKGLSLAQGLKLESYLHLRRSAPPPARLRTVSCDCPHLQCPVIASTSSVL